MSGVTYGLKPESHNGYCGFQPGPDAPACLAEATWHGIIELDPLQVAGSCDAHKADMERCSRFVHARDSACFIPGANVWWDSEADPNSGCEIEWDMGTLAAIAAEPTRTLIEAVR